jgi:hypothetical protein
LFHAAGKFGRIGHDRQERADVTSCNRLRAHCFMSPRC